MTDFWSTLGIGFVGGTAALALFVGSVYGFYKVAKWRGKLHG